MNYLNDIFSGKDGYSYQDVFYNRADLLTWNRENSTHHQSRIDKIKFLYRDVWMNVFKWFSELGKVEKSKMQIEDGAISLLSTCGSMEDIERILKLLIPWRKGPWRFNDHLIDSEWNSSIKYRDISDLNTFVKGKRISDIGGGNGYYSFRAIADGADSCVVYDPSEKFFFQFEFFQKFFQLPNIQYELGGYIDALSAKHEYETVFCMGVLYHQKNPLELIECLRAITAKKGTLILETMIYDTQGSFFFLPEGRYAKARNVYFLPTIDGVFSLLKRCGFGSVELVSKRVTSLEEQKSTTYMPYESLQNFLDKSDMSLTVEGHQRPIRATLKASKV